MKKEMLFCWLGMTDIRFMEDDKMEGPIIQALIENNYNECFIIADNLLSAEKYKIWLKNKSKTKIIIIPAELASPTDHAEIYKIAKSAVENKISANSAITFHLSPGTPAMSAIWLILSQTYNANLIESSKETGVKEVNFPFDLYADFISQKTEQLNDNILRLSQTTETVAFNNIIHKSKEMKIIIAKAIKVATHDVPVLITGESGTGKEMFARGIHNASLRKSQPFVAVNCGAIPKELFESEFFGHKKGSFTGASNDRIGYIEQANGGSLFLDELGEMPLYAQVKLLRALQEKVIKRVGDNKEIKVNIRIIAATNKNLMNEVISGNFREDLYHRIAVGVLHLPALRERKEDINLLIDFALNEANKELSKNNPKKITVSAREMLSKHNWTGNVRELKNTITRIVLWSDDKITANDVKSAVFAKPETKEEGILNQPFSEDFKIDDVLNKVKKHYLERALEKSGNNKTQATKLVGLATYQTFDSWLKNCK